MLHARRPVIQSRHARRNLDPALPLFVLRRIPAGDVVLLPGQRFDPKGIDPRRVGFLYRNRFIGHEPSRAQRQAVPPAALEQAAPSPAPPAAAPALVPDVKPKRARAGA